VTFPISLVLAQFIIITVVSCRKYNNAEETDLWEALMEQIRETPGNFLPANVTVTQVMDSWTLQDGYSVLTVTRDYDNGSATVSQVRKSNIGLKLWRWRELGYNAKRSCNLMFLVFQIKAGGTENSVLICDITYFWDTTNAFY